ncbi:MAG: protein kinase domain-containing protein [Verrucomicrobiota bacterium]
MLRPIAQGSYGEVWLARNELTGVYRAIKIIWKAAFTTLNPYEREFEAIKRFEPISRQHPGFVHILQAGLLDEGFYYIMELADDVRPGRDVDQDSYIPTTLANLGDRVLGVEECIQIGISLADSLSTLHQQNLIHRDIKPSNIIFVGGVPKLADIGLIAEVSEANSFVGTNGFIPPEGPTTPRADIFGLGKLLYEISTGRDRLEFPALPDDISEKQEFLLELNPILLKACHPNPMERHASAEALKQELEFLLKGKSVRKLRQLEKALRATKITFVISVLVGLAAFLVYAQFKAARAKAEKEKAQRVTAALISGSEKLKAGDYLGAGYQFSRAAVLDGTDRKTDSLRIGSTLRYAPKILARWSGQEEPSAATRYGAAVTYISSNQVVFKMLNGHQSWTRDVGPIRALGLSEQFIGIGVSNAVLFEDRASGVTRRAQYSGEVSSIHFATNGMAAVTTSKGAVTLWPSNREIKTEGMEVYNSVPSPSGKLLCLLGMRGDVSVIDLNRGEALPVKIKHAQLCYSGLFVRNEKALITTSYDRSAVCWDLKTGEQIGQTMEHNAGVLSVAESPNGKIIATAALDRTVRLWNGSNYSPRKENHILYHPEPVAYAMFISDTQLFTHCEDGTSYLWEIPEINFDSEILSEYLPIPNKRKIESANVTLNAKGSRVFGSIDSTPFEVKMSAPVETIAINPSHTRVAVGTSDEDFGHHSVVLFKNTGDDTNIRLPHSDGITFVTFSHDGEKIVTCSEDFSARIWDTSGKPLSPPLRHKDQVRWAAFNADDTWVATVSWDLMLNIWDSENGLPLTPPIKTGHLLEWVEFRNDYELLMGNSIGSYLVRLPVALIDPNWTLAEIPNLSEWMEQP